MLGCELGEERVCAFSLRSFLCMCAFMLCFCIHWEVEGSSGVSCTGTSKGPSTEVVSYKHTSEEMPFNLKQSESNMHAVSEWKYLS